MNMFCNNEQIIVRVYKAACFQLKVGKDYCSKAESFLNSITDQGLVNLNTIELIENLKKQISKIRYNNRLLQEDIKLLEIENPKLVENKQKLD